MATRKTLREGSTPPPATDDKDTERPPPMAGLVPLTIEQRQSLALVDELTERMVTHGVRRVVLDGIELELDPAAQYINRGDSSGSSDTAPPSPKVAGECIVASCKEKGGWLSTGFCREHFRAEIRNPRGSR
jgi:hypothetical protein